MPEINNLDILTDKIYQEGIEKAEKASENIISEAKAESNRILDSAKSEADKILTNAKREAERISRSVENELQLKGKQMITDLKNEIHNMISEKVLEKTTKEAFVDVSFLQSAVLKAIASWQPTNKLEIVLPEGLEKELESAFRKSILDHSKDITITFSDRVKGGFRITEKEQMYQISFSDEDFIDLFKSYLQTQTEQLLFNTSE
ncbi:MAG: V-type ATP synthase subunit E [Bacteroidota bacterium]